MSILSRLVKCLTICRIKCKCHSTCCKTCCDSDCFVEERGLSRNPSTEDFTPPQTASEKSKLK